MNRETLIALVKKSQSGDRDALAALLRHIHTPVFYQCNKLLRDAEAAQNLTEEILTFLAKKLESLEDPEGFETWMGGITAARAIRTLRSMEKAESTAPEMHVSFPSQTLNKAQTAQVAALLADALPEKYRMCLVLRNYCGLKPAAVGRLLGIGEDAVCQYLEKAEAAIAHQMQRYRDQGVTFAEGISLCSLLRRAMYLEPDVETADAVVSGILGTSAPQEMVPNPKDTQDQGLSVNQLLGLIAIVLAVLVLVAMLLPRVFRNLEQTLQQHMAPVGEMTIEPTPPQTAATIETEMPETTAQTETSVETETTETTMTVETVSKTTTVPTEATAIPSNPPAVSGGNSGGSGSSSQSGSANSGSTGNSSHLPSDGEHKHNYIFMSMTLNQGPGCTAPGWSNYYCTVGREVISVRDPERYPPLGHDYRATVKEPTTTEQGFTFYTCYRCGLTYKDNFVPPLPAETEAPAAPETQSPATQPPATEAVPTEAAPTTPPTAEAAPIPQETSPAPQASGPEASQPEAG